jgi:hypothetical protein
MSAAMKLVMNSAYGSLAAGGLTRFAGVHAGNMLCCKYRKRNNRHVYGFAEVADWRAFPVLCAR